MRRNPPRARTIHILVALTVLSLSAFHAGDARASASRAREAIRVYPLAGAPAVAVAAGQTPRAVDPRAAALGHALGAVRARAAGGSAGGAVQSDGHGLQRLRERTGADVRVRMRADTGTPREIRGAQLEGAASGWEAGAAQDEATARAFLRANRGLLGLDDPDGEMGLQRREADALGRRHVRFAQSYAGIPVWPAELTVHLDAGGSVDLMNGAYVKTPRRVALTPSLTSAAATERARAAVSDARAATTTEPLLIIYAPGGRPARLAWKLELSTSIASRWLVVVDASSGAVLTAFDQITDDNVMTSGRDLLGATRALNAWSEGGSFFLVDTSKPMYDVTSDPPSADTTRGGIVILDAQNREPDREGRIDLSQVSSSTATGWNVPDAVSAAFGLSETYDYFLDRLGRNSLDGQGGTLLAVVRFSRDFQNAFWNGTLMVFGDAEPYASALDVVAHELTHGVTEKTANLVYRDQSGALNEALSDIFGEMVEARTDGDNDWLLGSNLSAPLRNMADPGSLSIGGGRTYPARFSELIAPDDPFLDNFQGRDNGGVHLNSSIINHAYFQLAEGLNGAIGLRDAERIVHRAQATHLVANSQFIDMRLACIAAAEELFGAGSAQAQRTAEAFDAVEIFAGDSTPDPEPFPEVAGPDATLFAYYDPQSDAYFLGRREDAFGDDVEFGTPISFGSIAGARPAVAGDGSFAFFVDSSNDVCAIATDGGDLEECLGFAGDIHSLAMSPDGNLVAVVLLDDEGDPENLINVIDLERDQTQAYSLRAPAVDGGGLNTVLYADSMDFTADGRFLLYDAFNVIQIGDDQVTVWSIYGLDLATDTTLTIVPPVPGFDIGFPALSQTSDNFLTFDTFDLELGQSTVMAVDLNSGELREIATVDGGFGVPGYNGDDSAIVYAQSDDSVSSGFSLQRQAVTQDRITTVGAPTLWLRDGDFGVIYRRGAFTGPQPTATPMATQIVTATPTTPRTPDPTPTRSVCVGDCNRNGTITVDELVRGVNIALGTANLDVCLSFDTNGDRLVRVNELISGVNGALHGCVSNAP